MRKFLSLALALVLVLSSSGAFANQDMNTKLQGHWSKDMIEKEFLSYYFPYLAKNNFKDLSPGKAISKHNYSLSLGSFSRDNDLEAIIGVVDNKDLRRIDAVTMIGERLEGLKGLDNKSLELPFKDISGIGRQDKKYLELLYNLNIISGVSSTRFAPDRIVTQAEAVIMLQRTKGVLKSMESIEFEVKGVVQSHNSSENIVVREKDNTVLVTITKQFPTPGYSLGVEKIVRENKDYKIILDIKPPASDSIQLQVITYKTITIEINKSQLANPEEYNFLVDGIEGNLLR